MVVATDGCERMHEYVVMVITQELISKERSKCHKTQIQTYYMNKEHQIGKIILMLLPPLLQTHLLYTHIHSQVTIASFACIIFHFSIFHSNCQVNDNEN